MAESGITSMFPTCASPLFALRNGTLPRFDLHVQLPFFASGSLLCRRARRSTSSRRSSSSCSPPRTAGTRGTCRRPLRRGLAAKAVGPAKAWGQYEGHFKSSVVWGGRQKKSVDCVPAGGISGHFFKAERIDLVRRFIASWHASGWQVG
eukprot:129114-Pleurochrysis_carterae.AAC.1